MGDNINSQKDISNQIKLFSKECIDAIILNYPCILNEKIKEMTNETKEKSEILYYILWLEINHQRLSDANTFILLSILINNNVNIGTELCQIFKKKINKKTYPKTHKLILIKCKIISITAKIQTEIQKIKKSVKLANKPKTDDVIEYSTFLTTTLIPLKNSIMQKSFTVYLQKAESYLHTDYKTIEIEILNRLLKIINIFGYKFFDKSSIQFITIQEYNTYTFQEKKKYFTSICYHLDSKLTEISSLFDKYFRYKKILKKKLVISKSMVNNKNCVYNKKYLID